VSTFAGTRTSRQGTALRVQPETVRFDTDIHIVTAAGGKPVTLANVTGLPDGILARLVGVATALGNRVGQMQFHPPIVTRPSRGLSG
jgi:hypothetical protein